LYISTVVAQTVFFEYSLIHFENWNMSFVVMVDTVRARFIVCVSLISVAVLKFSQSYIVNDPYFYRFHLLLMSFVARIYLLILRPNLVRILLGWDGLGLTSYLLVIYYRSPKAFNSGMITALSNRVGDALILIRIGYLAGFGNWNTYFYISKTVDLFLGVLLIIAASTKRAQIPFSAWLPAAMAAPTPVSSLVHSSTLVTAGVYLIIRHNLFLINNQVAYYLIVIGMITITLASIRALFETDLKKIVALSTLSQLGVIMISLGIGAYLARFFHLLSHAFFKALLFISTGAIIHNSKDYQDLRLVGGRSKSLPVINSFILISSIRLIGIPFMSAFFSKEMILEFLLIGNFNFYIYTIIRLGIFLTAAYRLRFAMFVFSRPTHNILLTFKREEDNFTILGIVFLILPASLFGFWGNLYLWEAVAVSSSYLSIKILVIFLLILGISLSIFNLLFIKIRTWRMKNWRLGTMWALPSIRGQIPVLRTSGIRRLRPKFFDRGVLTHRVLYFNSIRLQSSFVSLSIKLLYKILLLLLVWGLVTVMYYLCIITQYNKLRAKITTKKFKTINSLRINFFCLISKDNLGFKKVIL
jgi:NADH-ubiquinone oxidoreductase chain 5